MNEELRSLIVSALFKHSPLKRKVCEYLAGKILDELENEGVLFDYEETDPRAMGWVGNDGLP